MEFRWLRLAVFNALNQFIHKVIDDDKATHSAMGDIILSSLVT